MSTPINFLMNGGRTSVGFGDGVYAAVKSFHLPTVIAALAGEAAIALSNACALLCVSCHSRTPTDEVFRLAPNGVTFDAPESIRAHAETIRTRVVLLRNMPLGNKTGMTDEERALLGRWLAQGAPLDGVADRP